MDVITTIKGNIILSNDVLFDGYLSFKDNKILSISKEKPEANHFIDVSGKYIMPGAIDAHVHCYSALEEGFENATRSAAAGGVTTIVEMPYDADKLICTEEVFQNKIELLEKESVVDVAMLATIAPKNGIDQIPALAELGACGFKVSLFNTHPVRFPKIDEGELVEAFSVAKNVNKPITVHAETDAIITKFMKKYKDKGINNPLAHCKSRPKVAESTAALTILELAYQLGTKVHLHHTTFPHVFNLVNYYAKLGADVSAETCTHYLVFSEEDMERLGAKGKINPPLRLEEDRDQLWDLLEKGEIDMVTSDHAPWPLELKQAPNIFDNSSGAPGVEVMLPILYSEGVAKGKISLHRLVEMISTKPANRFGLGHRKGKLEIGYDADFVVLDPSVNTVLKAENMHSIANWSPYEGMKVNGKILNVFVRGKEVYNGKVIGEKGYGEFVQSIHRGEKG